MTESNDKATIIAGLDFCQWCGHRIMVDFKVKEMLVWIDDDTGDTFCLEGFMNFHKPYHEEYHRSYYASI